MQRRRWTLVAWLHSAQWIRFEKSVSSCTLSEGTTRKCMSANLYGALCKPNTHAHVPSHGRSSNPNHLVGAPRSTYLQLLEQFSTEPVPLYQLLLLLQCLRCCHWAVVPGHRLRHMLRHDVPTDPRVWPEAVGAVRGPSRLEPCPYDDIVNKWLDSYCVADRLQTLYVGTCTRLLCFTYQGQRRPATQRPGSQPVCPRLTLLNTWPNKGDCSIQVLPIATSFCLAAQLPAGPTRRNTVQCQGLARAYRLSVLATAVHGTVHAQGQCS